MSEFKMLMAKVAKKDGATRAQMDKSIDILDDMFEELEHSNPTLYDKTIHKFKEMAYHIDRPHAEKIVRSMKPYGEKWNFTTIEEFMKGKGVSEKLCNWHLVMNMTYNDYYKTAETVGKQDDADFYFSLAKDFVTDIDAKPFKVEKYFM